MTNLKGGRIVYVVPEEAVLADVDGKVAVVNESNPIHSGGAVGGAVGACIGIPSRPAGSAVVHSNDVVHGVTEMSSGGRYALFLLQTGLHIANQ